MLISGPSSSGKTTFAKRLGIQLSILGMRPVLDLARRLLRRTGRRRLATRTGEYDYEALEAIDVGPVQRRIWTALLTGRDGAGCPRYNFITGKTASSTNHRTLRMDERSVLLIEGIHGLNPRLTPQIDAGDEVQGLRLGPHFDRNGRPEPYRRRPTTG